MPLPVRETQRVPRSCIPCSRRKVKCSKKIPCEQCIQRGDTATCMREVVKVGGRVTVAVDEERDGNPPDSALLRENISLKIRIRQLELALSRPELVKLETDIPRATTTKQQDLHSSESILSDFQAHVFGLSIDSSTPNPVNQSSSWGSQVKLILPTRRWSDTIVEFSLTQLGWVHCALDEATFMKEHDIFWKGLIDNEQNALSNHGWIAVYLSVLAVGAYFIDDKTIDNVQLLFESFAGPKTSPVSSPPSRTWYAAALRELDLADYTRRPSLATVQALAILNILRKNLGEPSREFILHGAAVNVARLVGIDHLPEDKTADQNPVLRSFRRRLWWTLVICDWLTVWSRPISIHPTSFTTVLETKDEKSEDPPSVYEYHKAIAQFAALTRNHINSIRDWSTGIVQASLEEIDSICAAFPPHLAYPSPTETSVHVEPYWCPVQRNLMLNCADSWRIALCVAVIPQILDRSETERDGVAVLQDGISAAKRILQRRCNDPSLFFNKFWAVTCATVAAGIFIALHMICFTNSNGNHPAADVAGMHDLVMLSISLIENSPPTEARHDALLVLRRLMHLYEHVFRTSAHRTIDRAALARIVRLVACPSLWDSLSDTESTVRFVFFDNSQAHRVWTGGSPCSEESKQTTTSAGDTCEAEEQEGGILGAWEQYSEIGAQNMETVPYFDQLFPSADLIDTSLPFVDSAMLGDMLR
ncbi:Centromere DNA-binding protein complex CBF3 subunit B [Talaromyces islandicus]|uniref:Centromere DNA-binding protein complex CBF3 subunit B n=1 Tax=Talaromyces islandicus TaxID=28573 RepID=A0A0U1LJA8_TALIS|nr:Centromere DNA-binding protein complex CBF3 subunit B [Talaromyces islandicus]